MISKFDDEYFNDPEIKSYLDDCENIEERKNIFRDTIQYNAYILHREFQELFKMLKGLIIRRTKMIIRDIKTNKLYDVKYNPNIDKYEQYDGNVLINTYGGCLLRCLLYDIYDKRYEVEKDD